MNEETYRLRTHAYYTLGLFTISDSTITRAGTLGTLSTSTRALARTSLAGLVLVLLVLR